MSSRFVVGAAWLLRKSETATRETRTKQNSHLPGPQGYEASWIRLGLALECIYASGPVWFGRSISPDFTEVHTHALLGCLGGGNTYKRARASSVRYERRKLPRAALTSATSLPEYGQPLQSSSFFSSLALSFDPSAVHSRRRSDRSHSQRNQNKK